MTPSRFLGSQGGANALIFARLSPRPSHRNKHLVPQARPTHPTSGFRSAHPRVLPASKAGGRGRELWEGRSAQRGPEEALLRPATAGSRGSGPLFLGSPLGITPLPFPSQRPECPAEGDVTSVACVIRRRPEMAPAPLSGGEESPQVLESPGFALERLGF